MGVLMVMVHRLACLALVFFWSRAAFGSDDESLTQALQRVSKQKPNEEVLRLRSALLGTRGFRPSSEAALNLGESSFSGLTVVGETPRDKSVSDFVDSVLTFRRSLDAIRTQHDALGRSSQQRNNRLRQVQVEFISSDPGLIWYPVRVDVTLGKEDPVVLDSLPSPNRTGLPFVLARTALAVGEHRLHIRGVAAAVDDSKNAAMFSGSLREPLPFEYQGAIKVTSSSGMDEVKVQNFGFVLVKSTTGLDVVAEKAKHEGL